MKKITLFCILSLAVLCSVSHANMSFRMESTANELSPGGTATVTISAYVDDAAASSINGLNYWSLSAIIDTTGVLEVVGGSIQLLGPTPTGSFNMGWTDLNQSGAGGTGSIDYLNVVPFGGSVATDTGYGGYDDIVQFQVQAIGTVSDIATYTLGSTNAFGGILADGFTFFDQDFLGNVEFDDSNGQNVFAIVPEPSSLLILSGLSAMGYFRRKRGQYKLAVSP